MVRLAAPILPPGFGGGGVRIGAQEVAGGTRQENGATRISGEIVVP